MSLIELPSEILSHIAELCDSKNTLAALSLTHPACRIEAEQVIYRTVSATSLETLALNTQKAKWVHCLAVGKNREDIDFEPLSVHLSAALCNTTSLRVFWLETSFWEPPIAWVQEIENTLCERKYDLLHTFYFSCSGLDINRTILSFPNLRILVGDPKFEQDLALLIMRMQTTDTPLRSSPIPLSIYTYNRRDSSLGLFPEHHNVNRISDIFQELHEAFVYPEIENPNIFKWKAPHRYTHRFTIHLSSGALSSDMISFIQKLTEIFPPNSWWDLNFTFKHLAEIKVPGDLLSLLPNLFSLVFRPFFPEGSMSSVNRVTRQVRVAQAEAYRKICSRMESVTFIDGQCVELLDWEPIDFWS